MSIALNTTTITMDSCLINSRKRKRIQKQVRFDTEHIVVIDTYSPLDYDRGSIFSFPIQYKLNPNIKTTLSLDIPPPPLSPSDDSEDNASPDRETMKNKKKPKLSIDTSVCAGPLFLTKLSTNHVRNRVIDSDEDDSTNDYLIPMTPTSAFPCLY